MSSKLTALLVAGLLLLTACSKGGGPTGDMVTALTQLTGQGTTLTLNTTALAMLGITLKPLGQSRLAGGVLTFPITSGYLEVHSDKLVDPNFIQGSIQHDTSGFSLSQGKRTVSVTNLVVDPGAGMLSGTVNGTTVEPLLTLGPAASATPTPGLPSASPAASPTPETATVSGTAVTVEGLTASLSTTLATLLDMEFSTHAIAAGTAIGTLSLNATASSTSTFLATTATNTPSVTGTSTTITIDATLLTHLASLGISLVAASPAKLDTTDATSGKPSVTTLTLPITGGFVGQHTDPAYPLGPVVGALDHEVAGIAFNGKGKQVRFSDLVLDPGNATVSALQAGAVGPFLSLTGTPTVTSKTYNFFIDGETAELTPESAGVLNKAFGTSALTAGTPLGAVHISVAVAGP